VLVASSVETGTTANHRQLTTNQSNPLLKATRRGG
jgi:hypothetical protein